MRCFSSRLQDDSQGLVNTCQVTLNLFFEQSYLRDLILSDCVPNSYLFPNVRIGDPYNSVSFLLGLGFFSVGLLKVSKLHSECLRDTDFFIGKVSTSDSKRTAERYYLLEDSIIIQRRLLTQYVLVQSTDVLKHPLKLVIVNVLDSVDAREDFSIVIHDLAKDSHNYVVVRYCLVVRQLNFFDVFVILALLFGTAVYSSISVQAYQYASRHSRGSAKPLRPQRAVIFVLVRIFRQAKILAAGRKVSRPVLVAQVNSAAIVVASRLGCRSVTILLSSGDGSLRSCDLPSYLRLILIASTSLRSFKGGGLQFMTLLPRVTFVSVMSLLVVTKTLDLGLILLSFLRSALGLTLPRSFRTWLASSSVELHSLQPVVIVLLFRHLSWSF